MGAGFQTLAVVFVPLLLYVPSRLRLASVACYFGYRSGLIAVYFAPPSSLASAGTFQIDVSEASGAASAVLWPMLQHLLGTHLSDTDCTYYLLRKKHLC